MINNIKPVVLSASSVQLQNCKRDPKSSYQHQRIKWNNEKKMFLQLHNICASFCFLANWLKLKVKAECLSARLKTESWSVSTRWTLWAFAVTTLAWGLSLSCMLYVCILQSHIGKMTFSFSKYIFFKDIVIILVKNSFVLGRGISWYKF